MVTDVLPGGPLQADDHVTVVPPGQPRLQHSHHLRNTFTFHSSVENNQRVSAAAEYEHCTEWKMLSPAGCAPYFALLKPSLIT